MLVHGFAALTDLLLSGKSLIVQVLYVFMRELQAVFQLINIFLSYRLATKFKQRVSSNCHRDSVVVPVDLSSSVKDIAEILQSESINQTEDGENRRMLLKSLSNIRFLARQSTTIRGNRDEENSNFIQLFKFSGEDDPKFAKWLEKTDNCV